MARKRTLNYRELRSYDDEEGERRKEDEDVEDEEEDEDEDEDEAAETEDEEGEADEEDEEEVAAKAAAAKKKKAPAKPAKPKRPRAGKIVRVRVVWKVFNNSNQPVATFDYARKHEAEEHAAKLSAEKNKGTFFVQPVKEPIEEK